MLERFYQKIFVAIVPVENGHEVTVIRTKNKKVLFKEHKHFEDREPSKGFFTYIQKMIEQSPLYYISILNPDSNQGAIEGCLSQSMTQEGEVGSTKIVCRNKQWALFASLRELERLEGRYAAVGLDFIFSPFSLIENFFADKIGGDFAMYALAQKESLSVAFFGNGKLEFAHHYSLNPSQMMIEDPHMAGFTLDAIHEFDAIHEEEEKGIRLDDIESLDDLDIIDELDDLSDIEDLDALEEIAEFSEDTPTIEEQRAYEPQAGELKEQMDRFNDDFSRFELIQKTLSRFYAGEHCHNRFIETVYVADAYGSGPDFKRYLEEELFLNVLIRKIDLGDAVIALAQIEEAGL